MKECCGKVLKWETQSLKESDYPFEDTKCAECGTGYARKIGSKIVYVKKDGVWICLSCSSKIELVVVSHPILIDRGYRSSAETGKNANEQVPFCPKCEMAPSPEGKVIHRIRTNFKK